MNQREIAEEMERFRRRRPWRIASYLLIGICALAAGMTGDITICVILCSLLGLALIIEITMALIERKVPRQSE